MHLNIPPTGLQKDLCELTPVICSTQKTGPGLSLADPKTGSDPLKSLRVEPLTRAAFHSKH